MLAIIDYQMGNLRSVFNAFTALGVEPRIITEPGQLEEAEAVVLPGVGAFGDGMRRLRDGGWVEALEDDVLRGGKPFLGICLGMQLLATTGLEHGRYDGLNWIPGIVERLPSEVDGRLLRVPHVGWNDVRPRGASVLYAGLESAPCFYFVHSYVMRPADPAVVSGFCNYGTEFPASLERGHLMATQFHPEKSHRAGLAVLKNFLKQGKLSACSRPA